MVWKSAVQWENTYPIHFGKNKTQSSAINNQLKTSNAK